MSYRSSLERAFARHVSERITNEFECNPSDLPGTPDMVFRAERLVVFVHGCFFHSHNCRSGRRPSTYRSGHEWNENLERTVMRDRLHRRLLLSRGWEPLVVWECQILRDSDACLEKVNNLLLSRKRALQAH